MFKMSECDFSITLNTIFCYSKEDEIGRACSTSGEKNNSYRLLVGKPERKRPLGRPRRRQATNIKMDIEETGWSGTDWFDLA
jgi:hypothetical protein